MCHNLSQKARTRKEDDTASTTSAADSLSSRMKTLTLERTSRTPVCSVSLIHLFIIYFPYFSIQNRSFFIRAFPHLHMLTFDIGVLALSFSLSLSLLPSFTIFEKY